MSRYVSDLPINSVSIATFNESISRALGSSWYKFSRVGNSFSMICSSFLVLRSNFSLIIMFSHEKYLILAACYLNHLLLRSSEAVDGVQNSICLRLKKFFRIFGSFKHLQQISALIDWIGWIYSLQIHIEYLHRRNVIENLLS